MKGYSASDGKGRVPAFATGRSNRQPAEPPKSLSSSDLAGTLQRLQMTAGNQAVVQMIQKLQSSQPSPGGASDVSTRDAAADREASTASRTQPVIQRKLLYHKPGANFTPTTADERELAPKVKEVDKIVETAYQEFMQGNYTGASKAKIDLYKLRKHQYDTGDKTMHPSTAAGYVIEGKVNSKLAGIDGINLQDHGILPNTIPDVSIEARSGNKALVDITASNSAGHILAKKGNWTNHVNIPVVAESLYPSIDFSNMMEQELSDEDLQIINERVAYDREMQELMEAQMEAAKKEQFLERQKEVMDLIEEKSNKLNGWLNERKLASLWKSGIQSDAYSESGFSRVDFDTWVTSLGVDFNEIEASQAAGVLVKELQRM